MINVRIKKKVSAGARDFFLDINIATSATRIALLGPSGSGKTLTIQAIAGLLQPDSGCVTVNGDILFDFEQGINLKPQQRKLAYLQQDYALFPHLTVAQNIGFGMKTGWLNLGRKALPIAAQRWVDAFELDGILHSFPSEISGGQKQRVALARALVVRPRLLLLDEPLAALDTGLRSKMRDELAGLQAAIDIPTILITHDPEDALALADQVFQLHDGQIVDQCHPSQIKPVRPSNR